MLSLLMNKYVVSAILVAVAVLSIMGLVWRKNHWEAKAKEYETQLISMTAARDLLLEINSAQEELRGAQNERRSKVEEEVKAGNRDFFSRD